MFSFWWSSQWCLVNTWWLKISCQFSGSGENLSFLGEIELELFSRNGSHFGQSVFWQVCVRGVHLGLWQANHSSCLNTCSCFDLFSALNGLFCLVSPRDWRKEHEPNLERVIQVQVGVGMVIHIRIQTKRAKLLILFLFSVRSIQFSILVDEARKSATESFTAAVHRSWGVYPWVTSVAGGGLTSQKGVGDYHRNHGGDKSGGNICGVWHISGVGVGDKSEGWHISRLGAKFEWKAIAVASNI